MHKTSAKKRKGGRIERQGEWKKTRKSKGREGEERQIRIKYETAEDNKGEPGEDYMNIGIRRVKFAAPCKFGLF